MIFIRDICVLMDLNGVGCQRAQIERPFTFRLQAARCDNVCIYRGYNPYVGQALVQRLVDVKTVQTGSFSTYIPSKHEHLTQCCFNVGPAP